MSKALHRDFDLTPEQLDDKYNPDGNGQHPQITRAQWRQAVADQRTISDYWSWVAYIIAQNKS